MYECKIHNIQWFIMPSRALKGVVALSVGKKK